MTPIREVIVFVAPNCEWCGQVVDRLRARGTAFRALDVTTGWRALRLLLRVAGRPVVPTVIAYGHVMVGYDRARLDAMLDGVTERADAFDASEAEQLQEMIASDQAVRIALGAEADLPLPELEGLELLPDDRP